MISKKITLTLTFAALTFCSFAAEPAKNWIRNGSFEKTPGANGQVDNWSIPKTMKIVPGGKDGKQYLEGKGLCLKKPHLVGTLSRGDCGVWGLVLCKKRPRAWSGIVHGR